jgi:hypothetical protein
MPFVKGQSGNPSGSNRGQALPPKPFEAALKRAVIQGNGKQLRDMAEKVLELAVEGEQWACIFVADRLDGKPKQVITGENGEAPVMVQSITYNIVDATKATNRSVTPPIDVKPVRPQPIATNGVMARLAARSGIREGSATDVMAAVRRSA